MNGLIYLLLVVAIIISMYSQFKVKSTFSKYSKTYSSKGLTGFEVAKMILDRKGIYDVSVQPVSGSLTDHYDPSTKTVRLSEDVYSKSTISAISVAAHEVGHAIQHNEEYAFLKFRSILAPAVQFTSRFVYILIFMGFFFNILGLIDIGIAFFFLTFLFQIITLPVEFDASRRALYEMEYNGIVNREEISSSKKVLTSAALTYVAATLVSLFELLRLILIRNSRE